MHFLHTSDWQIGMRAVHAGGAAQKVRAARLRAAERVCETAIQQGVDFLLIAGDTFEDNSVDRQLVIAVAEILGALKIPVFVLPGNHDPLQPGSVWEHPVWKTAANITVLKERLPIQVPGGTLLPCPTFTRRSPEDPTAWISNENTDGIRVVAAHGNVGELLSEEGGFPIAMDTAARTNADYVALGHWHSTLLLSSSGAARMAYSGTHEATRFGEAKSGNVLVVNIAVSGSAPEIQIKKTGELRWERVGVGETITTANALAEITRKLVQMPEPAKTLLEIVLSGLLFESDRHELPRIESAGAHFLSCRLDKSGLRPAPDDEEWVRHLPAGAVRATAARLQQMAAGTSEIAAAATQALLELYTFAHEVQR